MMPYLNLTATQNINPRFKAGAFQRDDVDIIKKVTMTASALSTVELEACKFDEIQKRRSAVHSCSIQLQIN